MGLKRTQVSGLLGMTIGGALLVWQFRDFGGHLEVMHWLIPAILIVLGVLYFLVGEHINGKEKKSDKDTPEQPPS